MYRTRQYHIRKGHRMFSYCADICRKSTNLYNRANYILRQYATAVRDFEKLIRTVLLRSSRLPIMVSQEICLL